MIALKKKEIKEQMLKERTSDFDDISCLSLDAKIALARKYWDPDIMLANTKLYNYFTSHHKKFYSLVLEENKDYSTYSARLRAVKRADFDYDSEEDVPLLSQQETRKTGYSYELIDEWDNMLTPNLEPVFLFVRCDPQFNLRPYL